MDTPQIIKRFTLKRVNKRGAEFDEDKLRWLNGEHIRKMDLDSFIKVTSGFIKDKCESDWFKRFAELYHGRVKTLVEFRDELSVFVKDEVSYREEDVEKFLKDEKVLGMLRSVKERLENIKDFTPLNIESEARALIKELGLKGGDLIHPLRVAVTGKSVSAGIFEVLALLGKEKTTQRLDKVTKITR